MEKLEKLLKLYLDEIEDEEKIPIKKERRETKKNIENKYNCVCGSLVNTKSKEKHDKTKKHINYLNSKNKYNGCVQEECIFEEEHKKEKKEETEEVLKGGKFKNTVKMVNTIEDIKQEKKEEKKKRQLRRSNYFLTINTNQRFQEFNEGFEPFFKKFEASLNDLFNNNMNDIIKLKEEGNIDEDIKSVETEFCIEKGPKTNCIHSHCMVSIAHYNNIELNFEFIVNFIKEKMELQNVYLDSKVFNNNKLSLKDYIEKTRK